MKLQLLLPLLFLLLWMSGRSFCGTEIMQLRDCTATLRLSDVLLFICGALAPRGDNTASELEHLLVSPAARSSRELLISVHASYRYHSSCFMTVRSCPSTSLMHHLNVVLTRDEQKKPKLHIHIFNVV